MPKLDTPCNAYLRVEMCPRSDGFHIAIFNADCEQPLLRMHMDIRELESWIANVRLKKNTGVCLMPEECSEVVGIKPKIFTG